MNLEIGDVVTFIFISRHFKGVVTSIWGDNCTVMRHNGETVFMETDRLTKTGEYIDIASILEKLKEE